MTGGGVDGATIGAGAGTGAGIVAGNGSSAGGSTEAVAGAGAGSGGGAVSVIVLWWAQADKNTPNSTPATVAFLLMKPLPLETLSHIVNETGPQA
jgi:hypothetical protein